MIVKGSANSISQRLAMPDGTSLTQVLLPIGTRMPVRATNGLRPLGTFSKQQQKHLPPIDKSLNVRRLDELDKRLFPLPKFEYLKGDQFDQFTVSSNPFPSTHSDDKEVTPSDYICFINRDDTTDEFQSKKTKMDLSSAGLKLAGNSQHSRVKSMDELLLEESMRRNKRNIHEAPDLTIMGANAPGYQCKWEQLQQLPEIKSNADNQQRVMTRREEAKQYINVDSKSTYSYPDDDDAQFAKRRVQEILRSEGFLTPRQNVIPGLRLSQPEFPISAPDTGPPQVISKKLSHLINTDKDEKKKLPAITDKDNQRSMDASKSLDSHVGESSNASLVILNNRRRLPHILGFTPNMGKLV